MLSVLFGLFRVASLILLDEQTTEVIRITDLGPIPYRSICLLSTTVNTNLKARQTQ